MSRIKWYKIADSINELHFNAANLLEMEVHGKMVCLAKVNDQVLACSAKCPHASGTLAHGYLDALGNIVCPVHRYKFSLQNGRNTSGEGYFLKTYAVKTEADGLYIGFQENKLFNFGK
jgi:3-phenylpropionate/trans-cinnamate dioxygenase ferredoxin subunit